MKILIAEDDLASRKFLAKLLSVYGTCDMTVDGFEAVEAYMMALNSGKPYNLICLDIMMPKVDGIKALKAIRDIERQKGITGADMVKVIVTTALSDAEFVRGFFETGYEEYVSKPIDIDKLVDAMKKLGLLE